jgi:hypothetical protein
MKGAMLCKAKNCLILLAFLGGIACGISAILFLPGLIKEFSF